MIIKLITQEQKGGPGSGYHGPNRPGLPGVHGGSRPRGESTTGVQARLPLDLGKPSYGPEEREADWQKLRDLQDSGARWEKIEDLQDEINRKSVASTQAWADYQEALHDEAKQRGGISNLDDPVKRVDHTVRGINDTYIGELPDGTRVIVKNLGGHVQVDQPPGGVREILARAIALKIDQPDLIPDTVETEAYGQRVTVSRWIDAPTFEELEGIYQKNPKYGGSPTQAGWAMDREVLAKVPREDWVNLALLDFAMGYTDRHRNNFLIRQEGENYRLVAIDNDSGLHEGDWFDRIETNIGKAINLSQIGHTYARSFQTPLSTLITFEDLLPFEALLNSDFDYDDPSIDELYHRLEIIDGWTDMRFDEELAARRKEN